ncbi:thioesterase [Nannizzia gypsea CBS 118893]|uniref:Thioesterase n=1 Tax=Arthroderma gypseum (strain ATCC MYA-4604 / CBS 118893) TaxID=535722 RepID=E4UTF3_ARTGP|nr:thioesterase [Nannizzia gypsea CBS 118893]EFR01498.1 thioesterase [Nannizzia gypsea CBS 118893]
MARLAIGLRNNSCLSPLKHQQLRRVPASAIFLRAPARPYSSAHSQTAYQEAHTPPPPPPTYRKRSLFGRILGFSVIAIGSFTLGIITNPDVFKMHASLSSIPSDQETNSLYTPPDEVSKEINDFIDTHPLSVSLRADPKYIESRPHMKYPAELRAHSLTGGTLTGPGRIVVPPFAWNTEDGSSFISIFYLGSDLCGHPGIVHGGLLATLLDEGLARTCFPALPNKVGVTANLNIDYRNPAPAGAFFVMRAKTTKVDGRKAWVEGWIESLPDDGSEPVKYVEAKALFIEPKNAALIPRLYKVT